MSAALPPSWLVPDWPAKPNIIAFTSSREAPGTCAPLESTDAAEGQYQSFNLALHVNDQADTVLRNRSSLASLCGLPEEKLCWLEQVHGTNVVEATVQAPAPTSLPLADASYSRKHNQACIIMTADCLPVLFCNRQGTQVAAAHAGWRGLASGILSKTLATFDSPEDVMAWFGPAIGQTEFEVGPEVYEAFCAKHDDAASAFKASQNAGKWLADLYHLARLELASAGVSMIFGGQHCSYTEKQDFYSYRRDGKKSGRMASVIFIR